MLRKVTQFKERLIYQIMKEMTQLQSKIMWIHKTNHVTKARGKRRILK